ncbi:hypothetical protein ACFFIX_20240 [Metabacillus herbersteinensis]|uniref:Uncharacterized protein n=1 Tax=Metabacillus herbersteinensis TaxID=283816 RepID=A0ABV6GJH4_9BACI
MYLLIKQANIVDQEVRERHVQILKGSTSNGNSNEVKKEQEKDKCKVCGAVISEKVKGYCLTKEDVQR